MQQFSENDLNKAVGELDKLEHAMGAAPLLRPDETTRITALNNETDPEIKAEKTLALMEELMAGAREGQGAMERIRKKLGLGQGDISRLLGGEHFDARGQQLIQDALADYKSKVLAEVNAAAKMATGQKRTRRAPRPGRITI